MPYEEDYKMWLEEALIGMNPDWICDEMSDNEFTGNWCHQYCGEDSAYITPMCLHMYYHHIEKVDRKTENSSEIPNNCKYAENPSGDVWECGCFLDTYCEHQIYDRNPDGTINIVKCGYEPKTEPTISKMEQVEDEPMKTTDYCDICKRDMCEYCIADATNPYCVPSHYEINYEPKDEPTTEDSLAVDKDINVRSKDEPKLSEIPTSKCHYEPTDEPQERSSE
jgi:hypothetical protein